MHQTPSEVSPKFENFHIFPILTAVWSRQSKHPIQLLEHHRPGHLLYWITNFHLSMISMQPPVLRPMRHQMLSVTKTTRPPLRPRPFSSNRIMWPFRSGGMSSSRKFVEGPLLDLEQMWIDSQPRTSTRSSGSMSSCLLRYGVVVRCT